MKRRPTIVNSIEKHPEKKRIVVDLTDSSKTSTCDQPIIISSPTSNAKHINLINDSPPANKFAPKTSDSKTSTSSTNTTSNLAPTYGFVQNKIPATFSDVVEEPFTQDFLKLIKPAGLIEAWLSNFMFDYTLLAQECPFLLQSKITKLFLSGEDKQSHVTSPFYQKNSTWIYPDLPPYGSYHSKAMVLFYNGHCRIVILTANFLYGDLYNKSQGAWYGDFPLVRKGNHETNDFRNTLQEYFKACGVPNAKIKLLNQYTFNSANVHLVPSIPGVHKGQNVNKWGHNRMKALLKAEERKQSELKLSSFARMKKENWPLVCQFSSCGSQKNNWLTDEFGSNLASLQTNIQVIIPTVHQVQHSVEGYAAGNSIPLPSQHVLDDPHARKRIPASVFKNRLYRWGGKSMPSRQRAMPHIKSYCRYNPKNPNELAWFCLSSSNLSKAAWGYYTSKNKTALKILSFELGVLFVPSISRGKSLHKATKNPLVTNTTTICPIPYGLPPDKYANDDEPWTVNIERGIPDVLGNTYPLDNFQLKGSGTTGKLHQLSDADYMAICNAMK